MLICELLSLEEAQPKEREQPRVIRANKGRFRKEHREFVEAYHEQFEIPFQQFLLEKATLDPPPLFGIKDGPLGRNLKNMPKDVMHAHIVRGKALVVYKVDQNYLTLYRVCDHSETDPGQLSSLADLIRSINQTDQWDIISLPVKPLDQDLANAVTELFKAMSQTWKSLSVLRQFVKMSVTTDPMGQKSGMKSYLDQLEYKFHKFKSVDPERIRQEAIKFIADLNQKLANQG